MHLRTISGVTSLLNKGKHCQASANVGLENNKKATCMKEEYIVINKKDAGNDIENIIFCNGTKSPVRKKASIVKIQINFVTIRLTLKIRQILRAQELKGS